MLNFIANNQLMITSAILLMLLVIVRINAGKPIKPKLILRFGDREVDSNFTPHDNTSDARLRSPRLFKENDDDKSVIFYSDMTDQKKHDSGFRKVK